MLLSCVQVKITAQNGAKTNEVLRMFPTTAVVHSIINHFYSNYNDYLSGQLNVNKMYKIAPNFRIFETDQASSEINKI